MAEQSHDPLSQHWVTVKDEETGVFVEFPHTPLEMSFDLPFQNTPSTSRVHVYSVPTQKGLLVFSTFHSSSFQDHQLKKEQLHQFFESVLVPHFFFNPAVFQDHQTFKFTSTQLQGQAAASFKYSFRDHGIVKKLEGMALVKDQTLYVPFYLASEADFDQKILNHFLESFQISEVDSR